MHDLFDVGFAVGQSVRTSGRGLPAGDEGRRRSTPRWSNRDCWPAASRSTRSFSAAFTRLAPPLAPTAQAIERARGGRALAIRRNGLSARAERQALAGGTARHSIDSLARASPATARPIPTRLQMMRRDPQGRPAGAAAGQRVPAPRAQRVALSRRQIARRARSGRAGAAGRGARLSGHRGHAAGRAIHARILPPHARQ